MLLCFILFFLQLYFNVLDKYSSSPQLKSSRSQMFFTIDVLKIFRKLHRKVPVLESFCNLDLPLGLQLYQKGTPAQAFSCEICKIFKSTFFYRSPLATFNFFHKIKSIPYTIITFINKSIEHQRSGQDFHDRKQKLIFIFYFVSSVI